MYQKFLKNILPASPPPPLRNKRYSKLLYPCDKYWHTNTNYASFREIFFFYEAILYISICVCVYRYIYTHAHMYTSNTSIFTSSVPTVMNYWFNVNYGHYFASLKSVLILLLSLLSSSMTKSILSFKWLKKSIRL